MPAPASQNDISSPPAADLARLLADAEKRHERTLAACRDTEAAFRRLFELNPLPMWIRDAETFRFLAVNEASLATYGYTREEFLAMTVHDIRSPEEADRFRAYLAERRASGQEPEDDRSGHWIHRRRDGVLLTVETLSQPMVFEGRPARLVIARDITEQLRAEEELRASRERFQLIAGATSDAIWDWDLAANTLWWNESFYTRFGYTPGQFDNQFSTWAAAVHPEDRDRVIKSLNRARNQGREFWREEYRFLRADGTYATVIDRGRVVRDQAGNALRMLGGMTDITEQSRLQAQFLRAQRLESIGTLAGGIAHDLNNMLAPILLALDLLRLHQPGPDAKRLIATIETSAQRSAELVRQVLTFARGVEGRRQAIEIRHLIKQAARFAAETFPRNLSVQSDITPGLWAVSADPTQINQVLLNLALNARDAMPGGGTLTFSAANLRIDDEFAAATPQAHPGPHVVISVSDTGHGIAPEHIDRIFEPFFTTKDVGKGTGLGLSTVHAIIREHGGFITVQSSPGHGATFRVHLPAQPELEPLAQSPAAAPGPRGDGQTILVIDDEPSIRDLTRHTLEAHGYRILLAGDGAEGVALFAQNRERIALVITDLVMPIMDGQATISALRRIQPRLPIIAASGHDPTGRVGRDSGLIVNGFLAKPYSVDGLLSVVADCIRPPSSPLSTVG
jgi:PAS domain S-box-containing protein